MFVNSYCQIAEVIVFLQQLEMLKYMRKFHLDDQSAILEKVHVPLMFIYEQHWIEVQT